MNALTELHLQDKSRHFIGRFSKYAWDLALGEKRQVYDVEVTWKLFQ